MAVEFEPFEVAGARVYYGNTLPYGLRVKSESNDESKTPSVADSATSLRSWAESGKIGELLDRHGALLIRGVGHPSAETFAELVNAVEDGRGSHPYEQIGLAGKRTPLARNVWTANEGSPTTRFYQHNEVYFACLQCWILANDRHTVFAIYTVPGQYPLLFCQQSRQGYDTIPQAALASIHILLSNVINTCNS